MTENNLLLELEARFQKQTSSLLFARLASELRKKGRLDEAIEICRQGLKSHPEYLSGYMVLGKCLEVKGNLDEARQQYEKALELDNKCTGALSRLGSIHSELRNYDIATAKFQALLDLDPFNREALNKHKEVQALMESLPEVNQPETQTPPTLDKEAVETPDDMKTAEAPDTETDSMSDSASGTDIEKAIDGLTAPETSPPSDHSDDMQERVSPKEKPDTTLHAEVKTDNADNTEAPPDDEAGRPEQAAVMEDEAESTETTVELDEKPEIESFNSEIDVPSTETVEVEIAGDQTDAEMKQDSFDPTPEEETDSIKDTVEPEPVVLSDEPAVEDGISDDFEQMEAVIENEAESPATGDLQESVSGDDISGALDFISQEDESPTPESSSETGKTAPGDAFQETEPEKGTDKDAATEPEPLQKTAAVAPATEDAPQQIAGSDISEALDLVVQEEDSGPEPQSPESEKEKPVGGSDDTDIGSNAVEEAPEQPASVSGDDISGALDFISQEDESPSTESSSETEGFAPGDAFLETESEQEPDDAGVAREQAFTEAEQEQVSGEDIAQALDFSGEEETAAAETPTTEDTPQQIAGSDISEALDLVVKEDDSGPEPQSQESEKEKPLGGSDDTDIGSNAVEEAPESPASVSGDDISGALDLISQDDESSSTEASSETGNTNADQVETKPQTFDSMAPFQEETDSVLDISGEDLDSAFEGMISPEEQKIPDEEHGGTNIIDFEEQNISSLDISSEDLEAGFDSLIQDDPSTEQEAEPVSSADGHEDETRELPILKQKELASMSLSTVEETEPATAQKASLEAAEQTLAESEHAEVIFENEFDLSGNDVESSLEAFLSEPESLNEEKEPGEPNEDWETSIKEEYREAEAAYLAEDKLTKDDTEYSSSHAEEDSNFEKENEEKTKVPKHLLKEDNQDEPVNIREKPSTPTIATVTLAEIYLTQGMKVQALDIYRKLQEREPDNTEIAQRIEEIELLPDDNTKKPLWEREDKRRIRPKGGMRYKRRRP